jgi:transcription termination/antitermination protein NusA
MKNEFTLAFNEVLEEKGLPKEIIMQALESAMISAYRRSVNASTAQHVEARVDVETGQVTVYAEKEVVEEVQEPITEVTLENAQKVNPEAKLGDMVIVESTPKDFGRVAAQTARQVIQQRIRDAERSAQLSFYDKQVGEIVSGTVQAVNSMGMTIGLEMKAEGTMPRKETIPGERFRIHDRVRALIAEVKDSPRGPQIILSRTHRNFLRRLLENEVPEIYHGIVEIRSIAREPGQRAKVAVSAIQAGIDPVGACVGIKGTRIQAIVRELHDEKIDVIEYNNDPAVYIMKAISPARVAGVYLKEHSEAGKTATVVVMEDQLSLAIGRDGQNARLAAKLTMWRIDIKSLMEAAADSLYKLQNDETLAELAEVEKDNRVAIEELLARKAEGRPLTPEEYDSIIKFVDRVEKRKIAIEKPVAAPVEDEVSVEVRQIIPAEIFDQNILDSGLPEYIGYILQEAGYNTTGELAVQMKRDSDAILKLQGIGPKALAEIEKLIEKLLPKKVEEPVEQVPAETEAGKTLEAAPAEVVGVPPVESTEPTVSVEPAVEVQVEPEPTFDELFSVKTAEAKAEETETEEEEDSTQKTDKKKKKKTKTVVVEYDPDRDITIARKVHKRGDEGWDGNEF